MTLRRHTRGLSFRFAVAVVLMLTAGDVWPEVGGKPPWLWTDDERVRARLDPEQREERLRRARERSASAGRTDPRRAMPLDVIDGQRDPALFFPTQLFERLVRNAFVTVPEYYENVVTQRSSDLFRRREEWIRFEEITRDFASLLASEMAIAQGKAPARSLADTSGSTSDATARRALKCTAKARALRAARAEFGRERFDRMLYEVAASSTETYLPGDRTLEERVVAEREHEENCR